MKIRENLFGEKHPGIAILYNNIGSAYLLQQEYTKALKHYLKALKILEKIYGSKHHNVATTCNNIAWTYQNMKDYQSA